MKRRTTKAVSITWSSVLAAVTLLACSPAADDEKDEDVDASCDGAASHFWEVCTDYMGNDSAELFAEQFRVDCIAMQGFYMTEARCAAKSETCEELLQCEISAVEFICDTDEECGEGLFCAADPVDCVACRQDSDCSDSKLCLTGLCIEEGNLFHGI